MAKVDWNDEWDMENSEVQAMIESFERMQKCDHEWQPISESDRDIFSEEAEECPKCGAVQIKVSKAEFEQFKDVLEEGRVGAAED
jgi:hypothetical protein